MNLLKNGHKTLTQLRHVTVNLNTRTPPWGGGGVAYFQKRYTYEYLFAVSVCNFESKSKLQHTQF